MWYYAIGGSMVTRKTRIRQLNKKTFADSLVIKTDDLKDEFLFQVLASFCVANWIYPTFQKRPTTTTLELI